MRKKPKILHWALFLMLVFATISCDKDLYELPETEGQKDLKISFKKFQEFEKKTKVVEKLIAFNQKLEKDFLQRNHGKQMKTTSVDMATVDFSNALYIEKENGEHSYTFVINDETTNEVKNFVLASKTNGDYKPYVVEYDLSDEEKAILESGVTIDLSSKIEISEFEILDNLLVSNGGCYEIVETWVEVACSIDGCWNPLYTTFDLVYEFVYTCDSENSGGSVGSSSGSETPGGGSTLNTSLLLNGNGSCLKLKAKTTEPETKSKLLELKGKAATQNFESGYVSYANEPKFSQEYQANPSVEGGSMIEFPIDTSRNDQDGFMHCHLDDPTKSNYAVFSLSDLVGFKELIQTSTITNPILYVTSAKGNFALVIKNKNDFINMVNALIENWELQENAFDYLFVKEDENTINQMKGFLNFFRINMDTNVKNQSGNSFDFFKGDANFENWQKISLDEDGSLTYKSC